MFKQIMVPLDGSTLAEQALAAAEYLAEMSGGTLHLVRVVEPPAAVRHERLAAPVNVYETVIATQHQEAQAYLDEEGDRLQRKGRSVETQVLDGKALATLLAYGRKVGIDLVVMTTAPRSVLSRSTRRSLADRLADRGAAAVLQIPAGATKEAAG